LSRIEKAREIIRASELPEELRTLGEEEIGDYADEQTRLLYWDGGTQFLRDEVSPDVLARSLSTIVRVKASTVADESAIKLGASKYRGLPHLPPGFEWPEGQYFAAQINLAELHPLDPSDVFPKSGVLYFFYNGAGDATVVHHDGPLDRLVLTEYPDAKAFPDAKYYLAQFKDSPERIELIPQGIFYLGGDAYDYSRAFALIPDALRARVEQVLGCPVGKRDCDVRLLGRPLYWQGEDEVFPAEEGEEEERSAPRVLLFQDAFGEGHIHFFLDAADAAKGDWSKAWADYSGT
jgi:hypothetical protein